MCNTKGTKFRGFKCRAHVSIDESSTRSCCLDLLSSLSTHDAHRYAGHQLPKSMKLLGKLVLSRCCSFESCHFPLLRVAQGDLRCFIPSHGDRTLKVKRGW